jgi:hypothetical protein
MQSDERRTMNEINIQECEFCGRAFLPKRVSGKRQIYCSVGCREKAKNKNRTRRLMSVSGLSEDNKRLRKTVEELETVLQFYEHQQSEITDQDNKNVTLLHKVADDLSVLIEAGVIQINKQHSRASLLKKHDTFQYVIEQYSANENKLIAEQKARINALRDRHRSEYRRAIDEGRDESFLRALKQQQTHESRELNAACKQYWAWYEMKDRRDNYRETNHQELQF